MKNPHATVEHDHDSLFTTIKKFTVFCAVSARKAYEPQNSVSISLLTEQLLILTMEQWLMPQLHEDSNYFVMQ